MLRPEFQAGLRLSRGCTHPPAPKTQFSLLLARQLGYWQALEASQLPALSPFYRAFIVSLLSRLIKPPDRFPLGCEKDGVSSNGCVLMKVHPTRQSEREQVHTLVESAI